MIRQTIKEAFGGEVPFTKYIANNKEVAFLKWQVLKWNDPAINFYKKYRAHTDDEWLDMKIFFQTAQ